jgi:hypothetical protein
LEKSKLTPTEVEMAYNWAEALYKERKKQMQWEVFGMVLLFIILFVPGLVVTLIVGHLGYCMQMLYTSLLVAYSILICARDRYF